MSREMTEHRRGTPRGGALAYLGGADGYSAPLAQDHGNTETVEWFAYNAADARGRGRTCACGLSRSQFPTTAEFRAHREICQGGLTPESEPDIVAA